MYLNLYEYTTDPTHTSFSFESVGPNGVIKKVVNYESIPGFVLPDGRQVINLAFGDWTSDIEQPDDLVISNNGDRDKVLATVAATIFAFCEKYGDPPIFATGSSPGRTRLYQMGINANKIEVEQHFQVFGLLAGQLLAFESGINYEGFIVIRKKT